MTARKPPRDEIDRMLRLTLADDLSADVEAELRRDMPGAWRRAAAAASAPEAAPGRRSFEGLVAWWAPWPRAAVAVAAAVMVVVGGMAPSEASPTAVESILLTRTASGVLQRLRAATGMVCVLDATDERGRLVRYAITWRSSGETEVRIERERGTEVRSFVLPAERASLAELQGPLRPARATVPSPDDPSLSAARAWLTPERLARRLAGAWQPIPGTEPGTVSFRVSGAGGAAPIRVTIDPRTQLPARIETPSVDAAEPGEGTRAEARFDWQTTAPSASWPARPRGAV